MYKVFLTFELEFHNIKIRSKFDQNPLSNDCSLMLSFGIIFRVAVLIYDELSSKIVHNTSIFLLFCNFINEFFLKKKNL